MLITEIVQSYLYNSKASLFQCSDHVIEYSLIDSNRNVMIQNKWVLYMQQFSLKCRKHFYF